jgi:hypothetical protein
MGQERDGMGEGIEKKVEVKTTLKLVRIVDIVKYSTLDYCQLSSSTWRAAEPN